MTTFMRFIGVSIILILGSMVAATAAEDQDSEDRTGVVLAAADTVAADDGTEKVYEVDGIVVTATRSSRRGFELPTMVHSLSRAEMERSLARTMPEALSGTPGVMVQKTAYGMGSPYLRGFTGFRTLFLVDGIRLNNAVFRDGPNQYWNTVDPLMVEDLEVVMGSGSVLYGTDAIGGVVNALPASPPPASQGESFTSQASYRYATAERSHVGRLEAAGTVGATMGIAVGFTGKRFGDLEAGGDVGVQENTGYDEWSLDISGRYAVTPNSRLTLAHQQTRQDDIWRSHKTIYGISWEGTEIGSDRRYTLDQDRSLTYLRFEGIDISAGLDRVAATVSYHLQGEDQVRTRSSGRTGEQGFEAGTIGIGVEGESEAGPGRLTAGIDYYRDDVDSYGRTLDSTGAVTQVHSQGPVADNSTYQLLDAFAQYELEVANRWQVQVGGRFSRVAADADEVEDPVEAGTTMSIHESWQRVVGSARIVFAATPSSVRLFGGLSQAFRAPNLSDLTRFDAARSSEVEVPSPDLLPENYVTYEAGIKTRFRHWSAQASGFYTSISDMIIRTPTGDLLDGEFVVEKRNGGSGYVTGVELSGSIRLHEGWTVSLNGAWLDGEADTYPTSDSRAVREPLDRLMPLTLNSSITWRPEESRYWLSALVTTASEQTELSTRDAADVQRIPPGGTPGYSVFTIRGGVNFGGGIDLSVALENIFDEAYRIHGSGQNEPGRNLIIGLTWR